MKKCISSFGVKIISLFLAFAIIFECNAPAFAAIKTGEKSTAEELSYLTMDNDVLNSFDERLTELFQAGQEKDTYEATLNRQIKDILASLEKSEDLKNLKYICL